MIAGTRFQHWKGYFVRVICSARSTDNGSEIVVYRREESDPNDLPEWRPMEEWYGESRTGQPRYTQVS